MMKSTTFLLVAAMALLTACSPDKSQAGAGEGAAASGQRVGVYDSRAVAIAFVGSEVYQETFGKDLEEKKAAFEKAREAGDQERMAALEAWHKEKQEELHKQGFSTAPVDNILRHIEDKMPGIKEKTGVERIVSKWDKAALEGVSPELRTDITMQLVHALKPNEKQLQAAIEIQLTQPISLEEAGNLED